MMYDSWWSDDDLLRDLADEPVMMSLEDVATDLDFLRNALRDLGYASIAGKITALIKEIDAQVIAEAANGEVLFPAMSKKQSKKQKQKQKQGKVEPCARRVVEKMQAKPARSGRRA
jgi:hypothetical protein